MSDIFISYKREDKEIAKKIAEQLSKKGYEVWWDIDLLPGEKFQTAILEVIKKARVAIVLWSKKAVDSDWVLAEAKLSYEQDILLSTQLEECDIPPPYNILHTINLFNDGEALGPKSDKLLAAIEAKIGEPAPTNSKPKTIAARAKRLRTEAEEWKTISSNPTPSVKEYRIYLRNWGEKATWADFAQNRILELGDTELIHSKSKRFEYINMLTVTTATLVTLLVTVLIWYIGERSKINTVASGSPSDAVLKCDQVAGSAYFESELVGIQPVQFDDIPERSTAVCRAALNSAPNIIRIMHQFGRASDKSGNKQVAVEHYLKACDLGSAGSCANAGQLFRTGELKNFELAEQTLMRGCDLNIGRGSGEACNTLGLMFEKDEAKGGKNVKQAILYYRSACKLNNAWGCRNAASRYKYEVSVKDFLQAQIFYEKGCSLNSFDGSGDACNELGIMYSKGEAAGGENLKKALEYYGKACKLKNAWGCKNAGSKHKYEESIKDFLEVQNNYKRGCELNDGKGSGEACNDLGRMYENGEAAGGENLEKAIEYYQKSCELKVAWGCANLGTKYKFSVSNKDLLKAQNNYKKGCELNEGKGSGNSCNNLGIMYAKGEAAGGENLDKAANFYRKACDLENVSGCINAGRIDKAEITTGTSHKPEYFYEKGCELSKGRISGKACVELGYLASEYKTRYDYFRQGCEFSYEDACTLQAQLLEKSLVDDQSYNSADLFIKSLSLGSSLPITNVDIISSETVKKIQEFLTEKEVYSSSIDGKAGPATIRAMSDFCSCV